ncbi:hypothetical protein BpHYR1_033203 [Brachionus plicatilis]|uniref:Uncharacterized protein n=1 Tax=Brachionus plicatilis TaxID=10195 RepID=A0A3M7S6W2_BRAPC|nr:hypothetical protein BpHYR1_033203 [Brachionus plicatilis]
MLEIMSTLNDHLIQKIKRLNSDNLNFHHQKQTIILQKANKMISFLFDDKYLRLTANRWREWNRKIQHYISGTYQVTVSIDYILFALNVSNINSSRFNNNRRANLNRVRQWLVCLKSNYFFPVRSDFVITVSKSEQIVHSNLFVYHNKNVKKSALRR